LQKSCPIKTNENKHWHSVKSVTLRFIREDSTGNQTRLVGPPDARKRACPVRGALDGNLLLQGSKALSFDPMRRCGFPPRLRPGVRLPLKPKVSSQYQSQNHVCYNTSTSVAPCVALRNGEVIV